jgi:AhpD family alkylhydroperoxidase
MQRLDFYSAGPDAIKAMMALEKRIHAGNLGSPLADLVRLRASQINGCAYCVDMHSTELRKAGEDERRIATVVVWRETPFFSPRERAALAWTEALTRIADAGATDDVWAEVRPHFSDVELVDLSLLIIAINGWNRLSIGFRKSPE